MRSHELPRKRRWLLEQMPPAGVCAEIGVWKGDFSRWILELTRPTVLHLIDPWAFSHAARDRETWHGGGAAREQADLDRIHDAVAARFAAEVAAGQVAIHRAPSHAAAGRFADASFDWVYIDGDHFYDAVSRDLALWAPKVKPGGVITGDDYRESPIYGTDVVRAVDEFAAEHGLSVESRGRQFLMRLPPLRG